jgi:hypothetical protein
VWSNEWTHDWPTWRAMLPVMVGRITAPPSHQN